MRRALAALALLAAASTAARAILPPKGAREDAKRFGFDHFEPLHRRAPSADSARAFRAFNAKQGGRWNLRFNPRTGLPASLFGGRDVPRSGTPDAAARAFLAAHVDVLGADPAALALDRQNQGNGVRHLLYRQKFNGLPVESAEVKVHLDAAGSVIGVQSTFEPVLSVPTTPSVTAAAAGRAAAADAGGGFVRGAPSLAIVPLDSDGKDHLAWKLRVDSPSGGGWRYFVDAVTGQVLFRYSAREFYSDPGVCLTSGVVSGMVYDLDPNSPAVSRPFNDQYVSIGCHVNGSPSCAPDRVVTSTDTTYQPGFFCGQTLGKVSMALQGPYISVGEFRGPSMHYDDGNGVWSATATPVSSPHPYPNNASLTRTIDLTAVAPNAVAFMPVFSDFDVGVFGGGAAGGSGEGSADIVDDDRLMISDGAGDPVANFIGGPLAFAGAAVQGLRMNLTLKSNAAGQENGYDVAISSFLTLSNPDVDGAPLSSHTWTGADALTPGNLHGEIGLFYHLNLMHDYFASDVNKTNSAPIVEPMVAMAHVGPDLINAFYDPDYDDLSFGDTSPEGVTPSDAFMDDATVPHHEYTHYMVQKIWDIQNYGQAGTLSEANADYWSATSLNDPSIGSYVDGGVPVRQLDDQSGVADVSGSSRYVLGGTPGGGVQTSWTGEIHADSPFLSQALWDIRRAEIARLGYSMGRSCSDGLEFQALLGFPESFEEIYEDMLQADRLGAVPNCGGAGAAQADIRTAFVTNHALIRTGDIYEPNDGFETATDISTLGVVSATIYPAADEDFYSFGAGPGLVQITMKLPNVGQGFFKDYQLKLYDASRRLVASAAPPLDGIGSFCDGTYGTLDCTTTSPEAALSYNNPEGGLLDVQVVGADSVDGSNSSEESTIPYTLSVSYPLNGALSSALVSARFDRDTIGFAVNTSSFVSRQDWSFAYAQLRNQADWALPNTATSLPPETSYLTLVSSANAHGTITGSVRLINDFASRFPSVGTVEVEVFGYDVSGSTASMGVSNPLNLSDASQSSLTAYNNLFNPLTGQKATVKYAVSSAGHVTLKLYTVTGRLVQTLLDDNVSAGKGSVDWNGRNSAGSVVASGIYVVRAVGPGLSATQEIAVVK